MLPFWRQRRCGFAVTSLCFFLLQLDRKHISPCAPWVCEKADKSMFLCFNARCCSSCCVSCFVSVPADSNPFLTRFPNCWLDLSQLLSFITLWPVLWVTEIFLNYIKQCFRGEGDEWQTDKDPPNITVEFIFRSTVKLSLEISIFSYKYKGVQAFFAAVNTWLKGQRASSQVTLMQV